MARKQLVKGANAARVEERIARVPADLGPGPESAEPQSVFAAIKALEEPQPPAAKTARISPSDFSQTERETIVRCCSEYRNRLPTYLQATQGELKVIDSVIEKCRAPRKPA